jgi:hypothetical protein
VVGVNRIDELRVLARALPGLVLHETMIDAPYERAWPLVADFEHSVPAADRTVRSFRFRHRRDNRFAALVNGLLPIEGLLEEGLGLMQGRGRSYLVGIAAEPTADGRTRLALMEGVPRRLLGRLIRRHRHVRSDLRGFAALAGRGNDPKS